MEIIYCIKVFIPVFICCIIYHIFIEYLIKALYIEFFVPYASNMAAISTSREPGCLHRPFSRLFCCHPTLLQKKNLLRVPERLRNIRSVCTSATVAFTTTCTGIRRSSHPAMSRHSTEPPPYFVASSTGRQNAPFDNLPFHVHLCGLHGCKKC